MLLTGLHSHVSCFRVWWTASLNISTHILHLTSLCLPINVCHSSPKDVIVRIDNHLITRKPPLGQLAFQVNSFLHALKGRKLPGILIIQSLSSIRDPNLKLPSSCCLGYFLPAARIHHSTSFKASRHPTHSLMPDIPIPICPLSVYGSSTSLRNPLSNWSILRGLFARFTAASGVVVIPCAV